MGRRFLSYRLFEIHQLSSACDTMRRLESLAKTADPDIACNLLPDEAVDLLKQVEKSLNWLTQFKDHATAVAARHNADKHGGEVA